MESKTLGGMLTKFGLTDTQALDVQNNIQGGDLINLVNLLSSFSSVDRKQVSAILKQYGISVENNMDDLSYLKNLYQGNGNSVVEHLEEIHASNTSELNIMMLEGYTHTASVNSVVGGQLMDWLEENAVDYLTDGQGNFHIKGLSAPAVYKVNAQISEFMESGNLNSRINKKIKDLKTKLEKPSKKDPNIALVNRLNKNATLPPPDSKQAQLDKVSGMSRQSKHKSKFDESVKSTFDIIEESEMTIKSIDPLFRLRELSGLPPAPAATPAPSPLTPMSDDDLDMDSSLDAPNMDVGMDSGMDQDPNSPDMGMDTDVSAGPITTDVVPVQNSEAMNAIDNNLNSIQTSLPDIRISEYKSLVRRLQDLTNQVQSMGKDYLGEQRVERKSRF